MFGGTPGPKVPPKLAADPSSKVLLVSASLGEYMHLCETLAAARARLMYFECQYGDDVSKPITLKLVERIDVLSSRLFAAYQFNAEREAKEQGFTVLSND